MPRPPRYDADVLLDAALELLVTQGARAVSAAAVARRAGVPSGSLYHRFPSRDALLAALWLRTVEAFQAEFGAHLRGSEPLRAARQAAVSVLTWTRAHPEQAQLLLRFRLADLLDGALPAEAKARARALRGAAEEGLRAFAQRLGLPEERVRFALVHVPYAAARASLTRGEVPPTSVDGLVEETVDALLGRPRPARRRVR
ncbi:TetR/AcrR family transcriptional regulator [Pyxidicoccus fallax]|uniref:TetR/AcrR family transcriptional regulator n=1 Tax=Pyxidicoccus fallax TaxID=394095 RepID=A0A848LS37_9BACT|nr:TetR/AcrR family transcriptional regulator [Pyxidicoccus fallax]NMO20767.1 TetR/AcrR family transcriptional regulator [Pyxidicoccus fallax]NPC81612.1 TetR/AcrR family transcriptional regulator [Pyxidicoccus fallax]